MEIYLWSCIKESFQNKLEPIQYNATLVITGPIRGFSIEGLYYELGIESLKSQRLHRKLCLFFRLKKSKHLCYIFDIIPKILSTRTIRNHSNIPLLYLMLNMNTSETFFPSTVIEWNKLDNNIRNSESVSAF